MLIAKRNSRNFVTPGASAKISKNLPLCTVFLTIHSYCSSPQPSILFPTALHTSWIISTTTLPHINRPFGVEGAWFFKSVAFCLKICRGLFFWKSAAFSSKRACLVGKVLHLEILYSWDFFLTFFVNASYFLFFR